MEKTIAFATNRQAAIFVGELAGQISDGFWENSRPHDHWKNICNANVIVAEPGYSGFTPAKNYNFDNKDLIDIVGHRMINYAKWATLLPQYTAQAVSFVVDNFRAILEVYETGETTIHQAHLPKWIHNYGIMYKDVKGAAALFDAVTYDHKDLMKDLKAIKATLKK